MSAQADQGAGAQLSYKWEDLQHNFMNKKDNPNAYFRDDKFLPPQLTQESGEDVQMDDGSDAGNRSFSEEHFNDVFMDQTNEHVNPTH